ncbi:WASH complex subunit 7-like protein [Aphelenchoides avenae]|nr:WASH complex subunit 7-like protein [Aphelenchus avenae]
MLISVFAKESRNFDKFAHLRNFFIIVPPLTINYVEHITTCRNRIGKRSASETDYTFFDDGFSVGIAYMLTLLNQTYFFDSLNWFKSVFSRFEHEAARTKDEHAGAVRAKDDSYAQTLSIRIGRLEDLSSEFEYVMFTLHSALLFLGVKDTVEETEEIFLEEF